MRAVIVALLLAGSLAGCMSSQPHTLVQSAFADTHLGWQPAPENQLAFSVATASGIARVELLQLPLDLEVLTLDMPGMEQVEGVQWAGTDGNHALLYSGVPEAAGVTLERRSHGFRLRIAGEALDIVRAGGMLTVIDYYRG
ncbi:hypothetical protein [Microbulbifer yueqingensis]|uniref:Uncharacterized protein n=1 Tax=Microbulbifer yueqingensis TaxID=658219 RepID=A0A1G9ASD4_9GAMM|nr:hypothetical protein [Microbulbifer yueqingensis]SDK30236.1 hypothetical protein SAMN05216212_2143 [Microbulbifer yueqingensis]